MQRTLYGQKRCHTELSPTMWHRTEWQVLTLLGVTLQNDWKFSSHVKGKLREANKCLYILRSLRKDGYTQLEINHLFKAIVLPKITCALPVYEASQVDLNTIQCFIKRCNKRRYTSELINIYNLLEKCDRRLFTKIKNNVNHPLYALLPKVKESSKRLRSKQVNYHGLIQNVIRIVTLIE